MKLSGYSFGSLTAGAVKYSNDIKVVAGEVVPDWWRKEGHALHPEDIADVFAAKVEVLVVGTGQPGRMRVLPRTSEMLRNSGIEEIVLPTAQAVKKFNELVEQGKRVAGAFHLTC
jgi:hypothetical protein